jgi:NTP pyrophosphatase (non-canonical NTP hydrolase)
MWQIQADQQLSLGQDPSSMPEVAAAQVAKNMALGLYEEVSELVRVTSHYKAHILKRHIVDTANVLEESVDVLKYLLSINQLFGITPDQFLEAFIGKTKVVEDKANGERMALERDTRMVVSDLDGCIADLSAWQSSLADAAKGIEGDDKSIAVLEALKNDFYRGGGFRDVPAIKGAVEGIQAIRAAGYKLVIVTARPYWQYKRVYGDTLHWLRKHGIEYDLILFNKDKAEAIYEYLLPAWPRWFIEDRSKHALELAAIGVNVLLLNYIRNQDIKEQHKIRRVTDWKEIVDVITTEHPIGHLLRCS